MLSLMLPLILMQAWLAANHSLEETQAEMARLQQLADAVVNIAEPKVTFRLIQVRAVRCIHTTSTYDSMCNNLSLTFIIIASTVTLTQRFWPTVLVLTHNLS